MLCCAFSVGCQGKQPCVNDNSDWLRVPGTRVARIAEITAHGVCTVASTPTPCDGTEYCPPTADGAPVARFAVTGNAPGACTLTVTSSDGSPTEDALFTFVEGPVQYCCESVCGLAPSPTPSGPGPGKTSIVSVSVAHLDDEERALVLGVLLEEVLSWVRTLPGSQRLRALLVFDEVYGYLPPHPRLNSHQVLTARMNKLGIDEKWG
ncbi:MAG: hypothetical protein ABIQ16_00600 [Polyangiaceae bacterium]